MVPRVLGGFQVEDSRIYRKGECVPVLLGLYLRAQNKAEPRPQVCDAGNQDNGVPVPARTQE